MMKGLNTIRWGVTDIVLRAFVNTSEHFQHFSNNIMVSGAERINLLKETF